MLCNCVVVCDCVCVFSVFSFNILDDVLSMRKKKFCLEEVVGRPSGNVRLAASGSWVELQAEKKGSSG